MIKWLWSTTNLNWGIARNMTNEKCEVKEPYPGQ
jgi:hypothetical protein